MTVTGQYEVDARTRRTVLVYMALPAIIALAGSIGQLTGIIHQSLTPGGMAVIDALFIILYALVWSGLRRTVTLDGDGIYVKGLFSTRFMSRDHIRARRIAYGGKQAIIPRHVLIPKNPRERSLALPPYLKTDEAFRSWLNAIPLADRRN